MATINLLPKEEIKFVKTIRLNTNRLGQPTSAMVIYTRTPSADYNMDYSKATAVEKFLKSYGEQCYPEDGWDKIITLGITKEYPSATVHTSLMMFKEEKDRYHIILSNYEHGDYTINILPMADVDAMLKTGKTSFRVFFKPLALYYPKSEDKALFANDGAVLNYDVKDEDTLIKCEPQLIEEVGNLF